VGTPITLTNRLLLIVPVTVVCDPLPNAPTMDSVTVTINQAQGKTIAHASGSVGGFASPFLTCDSTTENHVVVLASPDVNGSPFRPGKAVLTASATHGTAISCGPGCSFGLQTETGSEGPQAVKING
jgi:hypothetical protein